jgi:uncharacterized protein YrrD
VRKGKELIAKPIIAADKNQKIANKTVKNLILNPQTHQLLGFLLESSASSSAADVLPFERVEAIAPHGIVATSTEAILPLSQAREMQQVLEQQVVLEGCPVMTLEGTYLGCLQDLYFDLKTGCVKGYEVTHPNNRGDRFVRAVRAHSEAQKPMASAQSASSEDAQPWQNAVATAIAETQPLSLTLKRQKQVQSSQAARSDVKPFAFRYLERAKGRRVRSRISDRDGNTIAIPGQIVTQRLLERAKHKECEAQLCQAVGLDPLTRPVSQGGIYSSEKQIAEALGHPVTRAIVDKQGDVILNVGDLITHRAVARARQAQVLHQLLASVYKTRPRLKRSRF